jgi:cystathionine gamma-synthase
MTTSHEPGRHTRAVHAGWDPTQDLHGSVVPPLQLSTTFAQPHPGQPGEYEYARSSNPTRHSFEAALGELEGGHAAGFASGLAAIDATIRCFAPVGTRVLCGTDVYGGTYRLLSAGWAERGVGLTLVNLSDHAAVEEACAVGDVALIWVETPSNPLLAITDIRQVSDIGHQYGARTVVDNTFATPHLQQPLAHGADIVVHSATKYLGGHSDSVGGATVCATEEDAASISWVQNAAGAILSPFDSYMLLRGMRTLGVRMDRHCLNATAVAAALNGHPCVTAVHYPGLPTHTSHDVATRQQPGGYGGMVSLQVHGGAVTAARFAERLELFTLAESLGAVESLVCVPAVMTHASTRGTSIQVSGDLVRLSVGIEDTVDLVADVLAALEGVHSDQ